MQKVRSNNGVTLKETGRVLVEQALHRDIEKLTKEHLLLPF